MPSKAPTSSSSVTDRHHGLSAARGSAVQLLSPSLCLYNLAATCLLQSWRRCCRSAPSPWDDRKSRRRGAGLGVQRCRSCARESENRCDGLVRPLTDEEAVLRLRGTHSADRETVVHPQGFNGPSSE